MLQHFEVGSPQQYFKLSSSLKAALPWKWFGCEEPALKFEKSSAKGSQQILLKPVSLRCKTAPVGLQTKHWRVARQSFVMAAGELNEMNLFWLPFLLLLHSLALLFEIVVICPPLK